MCLAEAKAVLTAETMWLKTAQLIITMTESFKDSGPRRQTKSSWHHWCVKKCTTHKHKGKLRFSMGEQGWGLCSILSVSGRNGTHLHLSPVMSLITWLQIRLWVILHVKWGLGYMFACMSHVAVSNPVLSKVIPFQPWYHKKAETEAEYKPLFTVLINDNVVDRNESNWWGKMWNRSKMFSES